MQNAIPTRKITGTMRFEVALNAVPITATVAISEATERSKPRTSSTKAWPTTTMPSGAAWVSTSWMFLALRKLSETSAPKAIEQGAEDEQAIALEEVARGVSPLGRRGAAGLWRDGRVPHARRLRST